MAKTIILFLILSVFCNSLMAQDNCYCDTSKIVNFVDSFYLINDYMVELKIDRGTGNRYVVKTTNPPGAVRYFYQVNDYLQSNGEKCSWYANGQLESRFVYSNDTLIGAKNFVWYENGDLKALFVNKNDTVKSTFFDENRMLSHEETSYGDSLCRTTYYHPNGLVKKVHYINQYPGLILEYYCSGILKSIGFYTYSKPVGNYISFHEDGSVKEKGKYANKLIEGESKKVGKWKRYKKGRHFEHIKIPPTQMTN